MVQIYGSQFWSPLTSEMGFKIETLSMGIGMERMF